MYSKLNTLPGNSWRKDDECPQCVVCRYHFCKFTRYSIDLLLYALPGLLDVRDKYGQCSSIFSYTVEFFDGFFITPVLKNFEWKTLVLQHHSILLVEVSVKLHIFHRPMHALNIQFFCIWLWLIVLFYSLLFAKSVGYSNQQTLNILL